MGAIRSLPENQVNTLTQSHEEYYFITASVCGWQFFMEDFEVSITQGKKNLFAIIDGHNGPEVAQLCHKKLPQLFRENELIQMDQMRMGLQNLVYELEEIIYNSHADLNSIRIKNSLPALTQQETTRAGCSIILVAINQQQIMIANVGPCRCYVTYKNDKSKAILSAGNHIPSNKTEQDRITRNNGFIYNNKVNGIYPYTRSIGDFYLKKNVDGKYKKDKAILNQGLIISEPSFTPLRKQDIGSVLIGSSGIWEEPQKIGKLITQLGKSKQQDEEQIENLLGKMIASEPTEQKLGLQNMTITYINFTK